MMFRTSFSSMFRFFKPFASADGQPGPRKAPLLIIVLCVLAFLLGFISLHGKPVDNAPEPVPTVEGGNLPGDPQQPQLTPTPAPTSAPTAKPTAKATRKAKTTCSDCYGSGDCDDCAGTRECDACLGEGTEWCSSCFGSGNCDKCDGFGTIFYTDARCTRCRGTGECSRCDDGYVKCSTCYGDGECNTCYGSGECRTCHGDGEV